MEMARKCAKHLRSTPILASPPIPDKRPVALFHRLFRLLFLTVCLLLFSGCSQTEALPAASVADESPTVESTSEASSPVTEAPQPDPAITSSEEVPEAETPEEEPGNSAEPEQNAEPKSYTNTELDSILTKLATAMNRVIRDNSKAIKDGETEFVVTFYTTRMQIDSDRSRIVISVFELTEGKVQSFVELCEEPEALVFEDDSGYSYTGRILDPGQWKSNSGDRIVWLEAVEGLPWPFDIDPGGDNRMKLFLSYTEEMAQWFEDNGPLEEGQLITVYGSESFQVTSPPAHRPFRIERYEG